MPRIVLALYAIDIVLVVAHVANVQLGAPADRLTDFIDLDGEANLPTWYSSIQWFAVAILMWRFASSAVAPGVPISYLLYALPLVAIVFSLDEVALIHESIGNVLDRLLLDLPPGVHYANVLLGIPVAIGTVLLLIALRPHMASAPGAFAKLAVGIAVVLLGAIVVDAISFAVDDIGGYDVAIVIEEALELVGVTTIVWASLELAPARASDRPGATAD